MLLLQVQVIAGKYKGHQGKVLEIHRATNQVTVAGVNLVIQTFVITMLPLEIQNSDG